MRAQAIFLVCLFGFLAHLGVRGRPLTDATFHKRLAQANVQITPDFPTFWQTDLWSTIAGKPLNSIWMPGTHDSGTWDLGTIIDGSYDNQCPVDPSILNNIPGLKIISLGVGAYERSWSVSQLMDLPGQIGAGARYLDLRIAYSPAKKDYFFHHCLDSVASVEQQLSSISNWMSSTWASSVTRSNGQTPKEVLVLDFYQFYGGPWDSARHQDFMAKVVAAFQPGQIATGVTGSSTLQDIAQGGPKVILLYNAAVDLTTLGPAAGSFVTHTQFGFERDWPNVNTVQALLAFDSSNYNTYQENPTPTFKVMEGVLTEGTSDIMGDPLGSLQYWEAGTSEAITVWAHNLAKANPATKPFVLMLDFLQPNYSALIASWNLQAESSGMVVPGYYGSCSASSSGFLGLGCNNINWSQCAPGYTRVYTASMGGACGCKCCNPDASDCGCGLGPNTYCR